MRAEHGAEKYTSIYGNDELVRVSVILNWLILLENENANLSRLFLIKLAKVTSTLNSGNIQLNIAAATTTNGKACVMYRKKINPMRMALSET